MVLASHASPVWAVIPACSFTRPGDGDVERATVTIPVDPGEPVFAGHFPGFPIFPGVCVIECVHRAAVAVIRTRGSEPALAAIESARFLAPAYPEDELLVELTMTVEPVGWRFSARVSTERGDVARILLRYRIRTAP